MNNIFTSFAHFFEKLFGAKAAVAEKVLTKTSHIVTLAEPIVVEIEDLIKTAPQDKVLQAVEAFLVKYEPDLAKVSATAASLAALPSADLWRNAAQIALSSLVPAGTASSLVNLAIEEAYNFYKEEKAAKASASATPAAAPAAPVAPPAPVPAPAQ